MANTLFATEQYEDRSVTGGKIALTTILNENISATADIARTKILNTAVTEGDGGTVTGTISISGGTLILPQGTTLPSSGLVEGQIFWKTDTNQLFVFDGTIFQDAGGAHAFGGAEHIADTLANVNSKISDATIDDSSAARTPLAHASSHSNAGSDEITAENLGTASTDVSRALRPDGAGGLAFSDLAHSDLTGIGVNDHHNEDHASRHSNGGTDEVTVENLGTVSTDVSTALRPDGAGGLAFSDVAHADLTGVGIDDHHNRDHVLATTVGLGATHTTSGLTVGQVLRASGATAAVFAVLQHSDLGGIGVNDHHARDHALGGATHIADTLANLNTKISDATLDDSSSARTPVAHEASHISGGSDPFLSTDVLEVAVKRIQTTTGPTILTVGAIAEDEALVRSGSTLVGSSRRARSVFVKVRNETGSIIAVGKLITVTGFSVAEGRPLVSLADKDDPTKRPAIAITTEAIANNGNSDLALAVGTATGIDTSSFSINDQLVLGNSGNFSRPPPDVDPFTGEIQLVGSTTRIDVSLGEVYVTLASGLLPMTAAQFFATKEITPTGSVTGGNITRATGLNVDVAAGEGFVNDGTEVFRPIWSAVTNLLLTANDTNFIFVDKDGVVQASVSEPSLATNVLLGDAITDASSVILLANHAAIVGQRAARLHTYVEEVVGSVAVSGITTTKDAIALRLQVDAGTFYTHDFRVTVPATDPITFTYWFRDGSGGFTQVAGSTLIDKDNWDDGTGVLNSLVAGEWKKDLLFVVSTGIGLVEYHVFYGQEVFTSQSEAEAGNLPAAATDVVGNGVRSGGIVIEGASATIASVVDVRPFIGQLAPGTTAVSDHGLLSGLSDDDHPIYLPTDGSRPMAGTLDMGANPISNVGLVDGVDVSAHASRHSNAGADEITVENLGTVSTDVSAALRPNGSGGLAFSDIAHSDLTGVGVDDHHARDHAATHSNSGADEIEVEALGTAETDTSLALKPDGAGGLVFGSTVGNINTVTTTDGTVTTIATIAIPDNTVVLIKIDVVGRRTDSADRAGYMRNALVYREAAGSATIQGTIDSSFTRESSAPWDATISVSGNNALVTVKGNTGHTVDWKSIHTIEEIA